jgi:hypothetical protein
MLTKLTTLFILCFFISACGGGSSSSSTKTPEQANLAPIVNAGIDQQVQELASVSLSAQASDDGTVDSVQWTQLSGASVVLSASDLPVTSFSAPLVSVITEFRFRFTATDNQGASTSDEVNITVTPIIDNPVINAGVDQTVNANTLVTLTATATDTHGIASQVWTQVSGPTITLDNSSALETSFMAPSVMTNSVAILQLTVTDNRGAISQDEISITIQHNTGTISGAIKYENVPHTSANGLDYVNSTLDPVRGLDVELLDATTLSTTPIIIASTKTNHLGEYSFNNIVSGQSAIVRVKSSYVKAPAVGEASWDMQVIDNTNSNAIYALDSSTFVINPGTNTKNLTALSGWDSGANDYTTPRAAAPFHILDRAYDMVNKIVSVDSDVIMPAVKLNWSISNVASSGAKENGFIGTSHYTNGNLYILGAKDNDTDEYDGHVILHELGHYFEDKLSRADSIGGSHSNGDRLDMRVAFGEGFGNAWSGIISDDSYYRDSSGSNQGVGFHIDVENNVISNPGWYSEGSVQSILYDIYDSNNEVGDSVSLGLAPIYSLLIGAQKNTPALTSIFSFGTGIKSENPLADSDINTLLTAQSIVSSSMDIYGSTENNDAGNVTHVTPIYSVITANGIASNELCSINEFGSRNKLSVFRFFKFTASTTANYTLTASTSGTSSPAIDPDIRVYRNGNTAGSLLSEATNIETGSMNLTAGNYVVEVSDWEIVSSETNNEAGCFKLTITKN